MVSKNAYLFGSYAKGVADETSDVDIFVDSGLKGMKYAGFIESVRNALGGKDVDAIDKIIGYCDGKIIRN